MLSFKIALRYFFSRKSHNAVNIISLVSVAGVAVATAAIVCVLSVFNGFNDLAFSRTSMVDPQLKVVPVGSKVIANADSLATVIKDVSGVKAVAAVVEEMGLATYMTNQRPVTFKGVPEGYESVVDYADVIIDGTRHHEASYALLSIGSALSLEARPGTYEPLHLYVPRRLGRINPAAPMRAFRADSLTVAGVYQVEDQQADNSRMLISLADARELLDYDTEASAIELSVHPEASPAKVLRAVSEAVGPEYAVLDRMAQQEESFRMINIEKWVTFAMLAFILVIAAFNIITTLAMLITEKEANIATLRVLGMTQRRISGIFTIEGALVTVAGGVVGVVLGAALSLTQQLTGIIKLGGDHSMMIIDYYPVRLDAVDCLVVLALVLIVAAITSASARLMTPRR